MSKVNIFTTTFYSQTEEGILRKNLAISLFQGALNEGHKVFVVDGGTDEGRFIEELNKLGVFAYRETQRGLGPSRREALGYANFHSAKNNIPYLLWTEPEKVDIVNNIKHLVNEVENARADAGIPSRTSFQSYPEAQMHSESFGNQRHTDCGFVDANGNPIDTFFGPKIWRREVTPYFSIFDDPEVGRVLAQMRLEKLEKAYGIKPTEEIKAQELRRAQIDIQRTDHMMHMPICLMLKQGRKVLSIPIDYQHPVEQNRLETQQQASYNAKRLMQLNALDEQFALVNRLAETGVLNKRLESMLQEYNSS